MTKLFLSCIDKYLRDTGAEIVYGQKVVFVQSVLGGKHDVSSLKGMILVYEAMERLQWCEFFNIKAIEAYKKELTILRELQSSIAGKQSDRS